MIMPCVTYTMLFAYKHYAMCPGVLCPPLGRGSEGIFFKIALPRGSRYGTEALPSKDLASSFLAA